jgi:hypothetical protein
VSIYQSISSVFSDFSLPIFTITSLRVFVSVRWLRHSKAYILSHIELFFVRDFVR